MHKQMNVFGPLYTMTAYRESRVITPFILNLGSGWDGKSISRPGRSPPGNREAGFDVFVRMRL